MLNNLKPRGGADRQDHAIENMGTGSGFSENMLPGLILKYLQLTALNGQMPSCCLSHLGSF